MSPWKQDPVDATKFYAGYSQMYVNTGGNWTQLTNTGGGGYIVEFAIAPTNNQVIYVIHGTSLRKTIDGGTTWTNISSGVPVSGAAPTFITIDPNDENNVWVTLSGYSAANKVFQTTNGGTTWTNVTYNLPNLPANCSVYQPGTSDRIYVGMDIGVYTKDNSSNTWTLLNSALPNVAVFDMEISPAAPTLLRAATFGRGVYETELVQPTAAPTCSFVSTGTICEGTTKNFNDLSTEAPTSWNWSVLPAAGVIINAPNTQNTAITFGASGIYTVSLTASNGFGSGAASIQTVMVNANPTLSLISSTGSPTVCVGEAVILTASGANTYTWLPNPTVSSTISLTAALTNPVTYTVNAKSASGCPGSETLTLFVSECTGIKNSDFGKEIFVVFPNPAANRITIKNLAELNGEVQVEIEDAGGKMVLRQTVYFKKDKNEASINISNLAQGIYLLKLKTEIGATQVLKLVKD